MGDIAVWVLSILAAVLIVYGALFAKRPAPKLAPARTMPRLDKPKRPTMLKAGLGIISIGIGLSVLSVVGLFVVALAVGIFS